MSNKLLLADDSITIRKVVGIIFANEEYDLTVVDNGAAAIEKAREIKPDVILADVMMPGKNGYEVCEEIRKDPDLKDMPILLLSGAFEPFDADRARICGANDFISKPFESQQLQEKVNRLIELGRERMTAAQVQEPVVEPAPEPAPPPPPEPPVEEAIPVAAFAPAPQPAELFADDTFLLEEISTSEEIIEASPEDDLWGSFDSESDKKPAQEISTREEFAELENMDLRSLGVEAPAPPPELPAEEAFAPAEEVEPAWQSTGDTFTLGDDISGSDLGVVPDEELFEFAPEEETSGLESDSTEVFVLGEEAEDAGIGPETSLPDAGMVSQGGEYELEFAPEEEYVPVAPVVSIPSEPAAPPAAAASAPAPAGEVTLTEEQLAAAIGKISREILEKIAWEVVPDMAEMLIREEIRKIKKGIQE
jgi:CheY-like chemotaxis protein